jgi:hypothetical protein
MARAVVLLRGAPIGYAGGQDAGPGARVGRCARRRLPDRAAGPGAANPALEYS